jgi:transcriptional regulator with XRE-family HTH domain
MARSQEKTKVAQLRAAIDVPLNEFADIAGKSPHTINSLESGRLRLSERLAARISEVTGVRLAWLLDDSMLGPPICDDGSELTPELYESYVASFIVKRREGKSKDAPREFAAMLEQLLKDALETHHFEIVAYRVLKFLETLGKDFNLHPKKASKKSSGLKKKRP